MNIPLPFQGSPGYRGFDSYPYDAADDGGDDDNDHDDDDERDDVSNQSKCFEVEEDSEDSVYPNCWPLPPQPGTSNGFQGLCRCPQALGGIQGQW